MILVVSDGTNFMQALLKLDAVSFDGLDQTLRGIPVYWKQDENGAIYVWPKPLAGYKVYRLEPQAHVGAVE